MINPPAPPAARLVYLDPGQSEQRSLVLTSARQSFAVKETNTLEQALAQIDEETAVLIISGQAGLPPLERIITEARIRGPEIAVIAVGPDDEPSRTAAERAGVQSYLVEPVRPSTLLLQIGTVCDLFRLRRENLRLRANASMTFGLDGLVGISESIRTVRDQIARVADTDIPILLLGPSGCGKSLVTHMLHQHSRRRRQRMIYADAAVTPAEQLNEQLFGVGNGNALLLRAHGGTMVLRNVDKLWRTTQDRLAHFLKTCLLPTEGTDDTTLDIRFIATATSDLSELVSAGDFRRDLLERLDVITIDIPPLEKHREDIELLIEHFLRLVAVETGRSTLTIAPEARERLRRHPWPGDVRELRDTLRRAAALCTGKAIDLEHILFLPSGQAGRSSDGSSPNHAPGNRLDDTQRDLIERTLHDNNWNFTQTAQELGIGRTTLWRKVKKYNLKRETATT